MGEIMNIPKFNVEALPYDEALANATIFSEHEINDLLWLRIPVEFAEFKIDYIKRTMPTEVDLTEYSYRDNWATWIKVPVDELKERNVSQLFKIKFTDLLTLDTHDLFFAYSVQTENVEKPYIYVKDESTEE